jgi:subtilisin family serine protease
VAGIAAGISGASDEGTIHGVARDASIIAMQVFSRYADGDFGSYDSDQLKALERVKALRSQFNIAAVNLSLGTDATYASTCDTETIKPAIDDLISLGIATVIASGNDGKPAQTNSPGCISTAITVGSTDKDDDLSSFSNNATWVDLLAPGASICSSVLSLSFFENLFQNCGNNQDYALYDGTSMSTPHVAGAYAVMRSRGHGAPSNRAGRGEPRSSGRVRQRIAIRDLSGECIRVVVDGERWRF